MKYNEFVFASERKRTFILSEDRISVRHGEMFLLSDLRPEFRIVRSRTPAWLGGVIFVATGITALFFPEVFDRKLVWVLAAMGLVMALAGFKRIEYAVFDDKEGVEAISIARAGPDRSKFDAFVEEISRRVREATPERDR